VKFEGGLEKMKNWGNLFRKIYLGKKEDVGGVPCLGKKF
jgi:hypothetical protein